MNVFWKTYSEKTHQKQHVEFIPPFQKIRYIDTEKEKWELQVPVHCTVDYNVTLNHWSINRSENINC